MNQLTFGFYVLRTGFMVTMFLFTVYLIRRRRLFTDAAAVTTSRPSVLEGAQ
jgi:hypothetical protein